MVGVPVFLQCVYVCVLILLFVGQTVIHKKKKPNMKWIKLKVGIALALDYLGLSWLHLKLNKIWLGFASGTAFYTEILKLGLAVLFLGRKSCVLNDPVERKI